jgi:hypothetical protein
MMKITIDKKQYDSLCDDSNKLMFLEAHGVDNWQGYDDAMEDFLGDKANVDS